MVQDSTSILASVVICTYNRAKYLKETIACAVEQTLSSGTFEILVVDNGSTDETACVVKTCQITESESLIRYVLEPDVGLSAARNRAIQEARGQILCFLDDDAIPDPGWLEWIVQGFAVGGDRVACVGGGIVPVYEKPLPPWFSSALEITYRPLLRQSELYATSYPHYPYGANFSVRSDVAREIGGFNTELGYKGKGLIPCEETEFLLRIEKAGYRVMMEPRAVVRHLIPETRLGHQYYLRRRYASGQGDAVFEVMQFAAEDSHIRFFHLTCKLAILGIFTLALGVCHWCFRTLCPNTENPAVYALQCRVSERLGYSRTAWGLLWKNPRKRTGWIRPLNYTFKFQS